MAKWTWRGALIACLHGVLALSPIPAEGAIPAGESCIGESRSIAVWPGIVFTHAADVAEYRRVMSRNRVLVRQELEQELVWVLKELARYGADPEGLVEPVLSALMAFDDVYDRHKNDAMEGMPLYLEVSVRSQLERLYREYRIPAVQRKVYFANLGLVDRLERVREMLHSERSVQEEQVETMVQIVEAVDAVAYGTFSSDGLVHHLTLTLENVGTGGVCEFAASGPLEEVTARLSEAVFNRFQSVDYPVVKNPNPHLEWFPPPPGRGVASAEEALLYCRSQAPGGRLPYALELLNASQVGSEGVSYVDGGIPRLQPGLWAVSDRLHADEQYYYHQFSAGEVDNHPAGPVRTGAGLGEVAVRYWCVAGEPDEQVVRIERLYRLYRTVRWSGADSPALSAIEYLLHKEGALGAKGLHARAFPHEEAAWAVVARACEDRTEGGDPEEDVLFSRRAIRALCDIPPPPGAEPDASHRVRLDPKG